MEKITEWEDNMKKICSMTSKRWTVSILLIVSFCLLSSFFPFQGHAKDLLMVQLRPASESPAARQVPSSGFTITEIVPDLANSAVKIKFSASCDFQQLRRSMKIFPPVKTQWYNSLMTQNELYLKADFKSGQEYAITIPDTVECNGLKYVKTVDRFKMPDRASDIHFMEKGTVIERDSRQMVHVSVTNINELKFDGLQIPPLLIPFAIKEIEAKSSFNEIRETLKNVYKSMEETIGAKPEFSDFMGGFIEDRQVFFPPERAQYDPTILDPHEFQVE